jgi:hypothetical protein
MLGASAIHSTDITWSDFFQSKAPRLLLGMVENSRGVVTGTSVESAFTMRDLTCMSWFLTQIRSAKSASSAGEALHNCFQLSATGEVNATDIVNKRAAKDLESMFIKLPAEQLDKIIARLGRMNQSIS